MNEGLIFELTRVIAYGGIGMFVGFVIGLVVNEEHRIAKQLLRGGAMPTPEARRTRQRRLQILQTVTVVVVMLAMLLTGLAWMQTARTNASQDRRVCERLAEVSDALRMRTTVYKEKASPEQELWRELRRELIKLVGEDNPAVGAIDEYQASQRLYLKHLADNPYPKVQECR